MSPHRIGDPTAMLELVRLLVATLVAAIHRHQRLLVENLLLRQQLQVALRSQRSSRLRARDKLFWLLVRRLHQDWRRHLLLVRPETVLGWHRRGWRLFWRWRSGRGLGRPRLNPEVRELMKLGIAVSARSIRRYRRRGPAGPPSQSWRTFLANHAHVIWAADLFVVQTLTFQTLYVFFLISHHRRRLLHFDVTAHPGAAWVWRQMIEATPWGQQPSYPIHDHDRVYGGDFATRLARVGVESVRTPVQAPRAKDHASDCTPSARFDGNDGARRWRRCQWYLPGGRSPGCSKSRSPLSLKTCARRRPSRSQAFAV